MSTQLTSLPSGAIAALKGFAAATSFLIAGSLATLSAASVPSLLHTAGISHTAAAHQFALIYRVGKSTQPPAEILTTLAYGFLAYYYYRGRLVGGDRWKLYAGAALSMFSVIPWTVTSMEALSQKLVRLADRSSSTTPSPVKPAGKEDAQTSDTPAIHLSAPDQEHAPGAMTPAEEFEPYEDSPFDDQEYEREKVKKMLGEFGFRNSVRTVGPFLAGMLGLWALLE